MSAQDRTEKVLRDIHVMFSKAEPYEGSKRRVVIDKMRMLNLFKELNECMYDMMDEYELTKAARDKAEIAAKRKNEELIFETRKNAEDIYAASLMYSDRSMNMIQEAIALAKEDMEVVYDNLNERLKKEMQEIKSNQFELKGQLQDLIDTEKYLKLIEDENRRIEKEKEKQKENEEEMEFEPSPLADVKVDIKVNEDYFRARGYEDMLDNADDKDGDDDDLEILPTEEGLLANAISLDDEYFDWKEGRAQEEVEEKPKRNFFGFMKQ